eukprot:159946-Chlamydomonas_euryale.AAC.3
MCTCIRKLYPDIGAASFIQKLEAVCERRACFAPHSRSMHTLALYRSARTGLFGQRGGGRLVTRPPAGQGWPNACCKLIW